MIDLTVLIEIVEVRFLGEKGGERVESSHHRWILEERRERERFLRETKGK